MTVERKYAMTKIGTGDYLLPSNDGTKIWRLRRYLDGPGFGREDMRTDRLLWGVWLWNGRLDRVSVEEEDGDDWQMWGSGLRSRREAIEEALRDPTRSLKPEEGTQDER